MALAIKILSGLLLVWYGVARWMVLAGANNESIDWLANSTGNFIALFSILYLIYTIINIDKVGKNTAVKIMFISSSMYLWLINAKFLADMIAIFGKSHSSVDFGFVMLDVAVLAYYTIVLRFCKLTLNNKVSTDVANIALSKNG
jgi:hypothetical protein